MSFSSSVLQQSAATCKPIPRHIVAALRALCAPDRADQAFAVLSSLSGPERSQLDSVLSASMRDASYARDEERHRAHECDSLCPFCQAARAFMAPLPLYETVGIA